MTTPLLALQSTKPSGGSNTFRIRLRHLPPHGLLGSSDQPVRSIPASSAVIVLMHGEDERHTAPARARLVSAAVLVASGRRRLRLPRTSRRRQTARTNPIRAGTTVTQPRMGHLGRSLLPPGVELAVLDEASAIGVEARHGSLKLVAVELRAERLTRGRG